MLKFIFICFHLTVTCADVAESFPMVFTDEEVAQCNDIRIPQMTVTPSGVLLVAQCRQANVTLPNFEKLGDDQSEAKVVKKFSADFGQTWSAMEVLTPKIGHSHGQVVYDSVHKRVLLQYQYHPSVDPEFNSTLLQAISNDDGKTFGESKIITPLVERCNPTAPKNMQVGSAGAKIQTSSGRIIFVGHAKGTGCRWYTDDGGATYTATDPYTANEASVAEFAPGQIYMNARGSSFSWKGNRTSFWSGDEGATFSKPAACPIKEDGGAGCSVGLVAEPLTTNRLSRIFFSEPKGPKRFGLTIRCSQDGGRTWPFEKAVGLSTDVAAYSSIRFVTNAQKERQLLVVWENKPNMKYTTIGTEWCGK